MINRIPIVDEANILSRTIWQKLPHSSDSVAIKRQFSGLLSAHIDTYETDENMDHETQMIHYWTFVVRAGNEFSVSSDDIRKIQAYVNYEIDEVDAVMPYDSKDKVYILYGLINIVMINALQSQTNLIIPDTELRICNHFAKIMGFKEDVVSKMISERINMENTLAG